MVWQRDGTRQQLKQHNYFTQKQKQESENYITHQSPRGSNARTTGYGRQLCFGLCVERPNNDNNDNTNKEDGVFSRWRQ